jgi:hypothetical protein
VGELRVRDHFEDLGFCGRIILKRMLTKEAGEAWIVLVWFRIGTGTGHL